MGNHQCENLSIMETITDEEDGVGPTAYGFINAWRTGCHQVQARQFDWAYICRDCVNHGPWRNCQGQRYLYERGLWPLIDGNHLGERHADFEN